MPTPFRVHYTGAIYHAMARGNDHKAIFLDDVGRIRFMTLLTRAVNHYEATIHAYALMTTHFHLLIQVEEIPLSTIMRDVIGMYARYFNWKYGHSGHVFQAPYLPVLCKNDAQLLNVLRYITLNPVPKLVRSPHEWKWSSHHAYLGRPDDLVETSLCMSYFRGDRPARETYERFILARAPAAWPHPGISHEDEWENPAEDRAAVPLIPAALYQLAQAVAREIGVGFEDLCGAGSSRPRSVSAARRSLVRRALENGFRLAEIARLLGCTRTALSLGAARNQ